MFFVFFLRHSERSDFLLNVPFCFCSGVHQVALVDVADEDQVNDACVFTLRVIVDQESLFQAPQALDNRFQNLIHAQGFFNHRRKFAGQGMFLVGGTKKLSPLLVADQGFGLAQLIKFIFDLAGGRLKIIGQFTQVGCPIGVKEETHQNFDASL